MLAQIPQSGIVRSLKAKTNKSKHLTPRVDYHDWLVQLRAEEIPTCRLVRFCFLSCVFLCSLSFVPYGLVSFHLQLFTKTTFFLSYIIRENTHKDDVSSVLDIVPLIFKNSSSVLVSYELWRGQNLELSATWAWGWVCSAYIRPLSSLLWPCSSFCNLANKQWKYLKGLLLCFHHIGSEMFIFRVLFNWCGKWIGSSVELL